MNGAEQSCIRLPFIIHLFTLPTMSTIVTVPTGRYIVTNQTRPLNNALEGDPVGVRLGVPATKPPHLQAVSRR